ncbi:MAG: hypothetical protein P8R42_18400 [Candidatus Binatia bacterium]|nr:hypothetical protein [Candidatus Binatia bacterium]
MKRLTIASIALALLLATTSPAEAICGCPSGGVPRLLSAVMSGNDLDELRGDCTQPGMTVEVQVRQQHFYRKSSLPLGLGGPFEGACINGCQWITIGSTQSGPVAGHFTFSNLDQSQSVQLLASLWSVIGLDGVRTDLRVRAWDPSANQWSAWTEPPVLEAFNVMWNGNEGAAAAVETRITGATKMHVTVADGPDDGDQPTIQLDVDTDTPNFWLGQQTGDPTVLYHWTGSCSPPIAWCPPEWLVQLAPAITVDAPAFAANSEYPFLLGMATASRPGAMVIATTVLGPRDTSDFSVQVDVDVNVDVVIDLNLGIDFFSIF